MASVDKGDLETINQSQIYALTHNDRVIYVGATTRPLRSRLVEHLSRAAGDSERAVHRYMREHNLSNIDIMPLDYESEQQAIDDHPEAHNANDAEPAPELEYEWTLDELETLRSAPSISAASEQLEASYHQCRCACRRLGWHQTDRSYTHVDWYIWEPLMGHLPDEHIATLAGTTQANARREREKRGIDAAGSSALTDSQACEAYIRYHSYDDVTQRELVDEMEVSIDVVNDVVNRKGAYSDLSVPCKAAIEVAKAYDQANREVPSTRLDLLKSDRSDARVAQLMGVSTQRVSEMREELGTQS